MLQKSSISQSIYLCEQCLVVLNKVVFGYQTKQKISTFLGVNFTMSLQVELLEQSFEGIKPQADAFANSFYDNLFTAYPEAKPLFISTNMPEQKKKLLSSLVLVVENLRNPELLSNALRGLGARHVKYGALAEHYPLVGNALLTTFEQYLGDKWTPGVKQAWVDAYSAISEIMLDGADYSQAEIALDAPTKSPGDSKVAKGDPNYNDKQFR